MESWFMKPQHSALNNFQVSNQGCSHDHGVLVLQKVSLACDKQCFNRTNCGYSGSNLCHNHASPLQRYRRDRYSKRSIFDIFWEQFHGPPPVTMDHVAQDHVEQSFSVSSQQFGIPLGCYNVYLAKETHQIAEATAEKNAKLREAFGLGEHYVDGSSFDPNRKAKEEAAKALAMAQKKYTIVKGSDSETEVSPERSRKRKKKTRDTSSSPERKDKKKKSKKHRHERYVTKRSR